MGPSRGVQDEAPLHGIDRGRDAGRGEPRYVLLGQLARREPGSGRYARRHSVDPKGAPVVAIDVPGNEIPTTPGVDEPVRLGGTDARRPGLVPTVEAQPLMVRQTAATAWSLPAGLRRKQFALSSSVANIIAEARLKPGSHTTTYSGAGYRHRSTGLGWRRARWPGSSVCWCSWWGPSRGIEVIRHPCVDRAHQESTPREIQASSDLKPRRHDG